jgi:MinD-like ATPase involved in chromosome partitioning or flagellar assembly
VYVRHTVVRKGGRAHTYWRLVRSVRRGRKAVQETVAQLGELHIELLGTIPLVAELRASMDRGTPLFIAQPEHPVSRTLADIASQPIVALDRRSTTVSTH